MARDSVEQRWSDSRLLAGCSPSRVVESGQKLPSEQAEIGQKQSFGCVGNLGG